MLHSGEVGSARAGLADGASARARDSKEGSRIVDTGVSQYGEAMLRSQIYCSSTPTAGISTVSSSSFLSLYNPLGSGVVALVIDIDAAYVSGILGGGDPQFMTNILPFNPQILASNITTYPITQALIGSSVVPKCSFQLNTTMASVGGGVRGVRDLWAVGTAFTSNPTLYMGQASKDLKGQFAVYPTQALYYTISQAAGSSPLVMMSITWMEVPTLDQDFFRFGG